MPIFEVSLLSGALGIYGLVRGARHVVYTNKLKKTKYSRYHIPLSRVIWMLDGKDTTLKWHFPILEKGIFRDMYYFREFTKRNPLRAFGCIIPDTKNFGVDLPFQQFQKSLLAALTYVVGSGYSLEEREKTVSPPWYSFHLKSQQLAELDPMLSSDSSFKDVLDQKEAKYILGMNNPGIDIDIAYKNLMMVNHPDRGGSSFIAEKINLAKDKLSGVDMNPEMESKKHQPMGDNVATGSFPDGYEDEMHMWNEMAAPKPRGMEQGEKVMQRMEEEFQDYLENPVCRNPFKTQERSDRWRLEHILMTRATSEFHTSLEDDHPSKEPMWLRELRETLMPAYVHQHRVREWNLRKNLKEEFGITRRRWLEDQWYLDWLDKEREGETLDLKLKSPEQLHVEAEKYLFENYNLWTSGKLSWFHHDRHPDRILGRHRDRRVYRQRMLDRRMAEMTTKFSETPVENTDHVTTPVDSNIDPEHR